MSSRTTIRVGARPSPLSLAQTEEVLALLRAAYPDCEFVVVPISTQGDREKDAPLLSLGRGMFVKDIERALEAREIDVAVHSAKDLAPEIPAGMGVTSVGKRGDPRDVLINKWRLKLLELPPGARIGTSSPRRMAQIRIKRPDLTLLEIRGNVGTRIEKSGGDDYDGVVLAAAGLARLGRNSEITEYFEADFFTPDSGQGILAAEARADDTAILDMLNKVQHGPTANAFAAERSFLGALGGGCKVPVAAHARQEGSMVHISAMAALPDGSRIFRARIRWSARDAANGGRRIAEDLLNNGAKEILS